MRQESNREMDVLLRRLARRGDDGASAESERTDHLDADELNAYAENVLPAAARASYTEHLAECARCRDLIVQLSSAGGAVAAVHAVTASEPSGLRKFLAALFSPMVLRYAAPALGVIIVTAIGVFVFRDRNRYLDEAVAQRDRVETPAAKEPVESAPAQQPSGGINDSLDQKTQPEKQEKNDRSQQAAPPPPNMPLSVDIHAEVKPQESPAKNAQVEQLAKAPAAPTPVSDDEVAKRREQDAPNKKREEEAQKQKATVESAAGKEPPADKPVAQPKVDEVRAAAPSTAARRRGRGDFGVASTQSAGAAPGAAQKDAEEAKVRRDEAETRTVAGRQFRKQRGVWIDTGYDSSKGAITLTRGSEQYRALIADEPQIQTIADGLDGEIIVVWKGRAYRIR